MNVSLIIPTYNGAHKLPDIISAIQKQSFQPNEIVVVIDGSTDNTYEVLKKLQVDLSTLIIIEQINKGRAAVRNKGAMEASGELLIFFDDDMLPIQDCIHQHVLHHTITSNSILTGAQIDLGTQERSDIQRYKSFLSEKWSKNLRDKGQDKLGKDEIFITAANFSIFKKTFVEIGGFDERLTDAEDYDLAVRAFKNGIPLYFSYKAFAWHKDDITGISYIRRLRQYNKAHMQLKNLKPDLFNDVKNYSLQLPVGVKKHFFQLFNNKTCIDWLDNKSFKNIVPKKIRYKLYDYIITANGVYFPEKVPL